MPVSRATACRPSTSDKFIRIFSNAGETQLKITSQIKPMVDYEQMHRIGNLRLGEGYRGEMTFRYSDPDLTIEDISTNNGTRMRSVES